ncbi:Phage tail protein [Sulfidibacter corallicola]|uniref:Phage tail protein n=1 Tax=Sulfidibacter corallicola TaxID=2818388 RepID=A0A8A4TJZ5_SULCO|nr:tail fiber protein [Sulfidibacter corallicola]QTD50256.1 phage tail protein [Sulfidibacter corallicola]
MSESFLGEIRMFGGNFAPRDWAICNGQLLNVNDNQALFSLLGTMYGGDGRATFGVPDYRGRIPLGFGQGPGLTNRSQGARFGEPSVTLVESTMPVHTHPMQGSANTANTTLPGGHILAEVDGVFYEPQQAGDKLQDFPDNVVGSTGGGLAHENHMATLCINYIISLKGTYPSRS